MGSLPAAAQYARPDAVALSADAPTPDSLARVLTKDFSEDRDKVRAIFRWITANIRYQLRGKSARHGARWNPDSDTAYDGRPADERAAYSVLRSREAVCEGYARLFNTLCRYSGIRSVLVRGFVRNDSDPADRSFSSNHSWNAVWLDSSWQLLDATWAAGYVRSGSDEFTPSLDEFYYLTPPAAFARNHFPEDPQWALLPDFEPLQEFRYGPFRGPAAQKFRVISVLPGRGLLRVTPGDTLRLRVELRDPLDPAGYARALGPDEAPPALLQGLVRLEPLTVFPAQVLEYRYVARPGDRWLQLCCNGESLLQYRVEGSTHGSGAACE
ncbi:transglutaminase domain-containing protein [Flaviaesturariibacter terrae]